MELQTLGIAQEATTGELERWKEVGGLTGDSGFDQHRTMGHLTVLVRLTWRLFILFVFEMGLLKATYTWVLFHQSIILLCDF